MGRDVAIGRRHPVRGALAPEAADRNGPSVVVDHGHAQATALLRSYRGSVSSLVAGEER